MTTTDYAPSDEFRAMIQRRKLAAQRLGVTARQREAIRRSKTWTSLTGSTEFVDISPDPHGRRFETKGVPN
jgi:hypothetical protein